MSKEAIRLQTEVINATAKLRRLGFRIECTYIPGAGWASELVNNNTGELHEQDIIDAQQEKNRDYALDNTRGTWTSEQSRRKEK